MAEIVVLTPGLSVRDRDWELFEAAKKVSGNAYAPYSTFHVGAALQTVAGNQYVACNVENASYGLSVCAERNAVFAAVAAEGPSMRIDTLAIYVDAHTAPSCGACRQVTAQFGEASRIVFPYQGGVGLISLEGLLPIPFELAPRE